jgi:hypothetical protein
MVPTSSKSPPRRAAAATRARTPILRTGGSRASRAFGAVTTLAGAALGGAISYLLSRQQIRDARAQRLEGERWDRARRSLERRLDVYGDFVTQARRYRNAIRPSYHPGADPRLPVREIDDLARTADAAGSLVFLVSENPRTQSACGSVLRTLGQVEGVLHELDGDADGEPWDKLNEDMERALRGFQSAAREELGVEDAGQRQGGPAVNPSDLACQAQLYAELADLRPINGAEQYATYRPYRRISRLSPGCSSVGRCA